MCLGSSGWFLLITPLRTSHQAAVVHRSVSGHECRQVSSHQSIRSSQEIFPRCCAPACLVYIYSASCVHSNSVTRYKHYERWATANDFPVENVINDGSTTLEDQLGAVADLQLAIRSRKQQDDIMVVRLPQCPDCFHLVANQKCCNGAEGGTWFVANRLPETCCVQTRTLTSLKSSVSSSQR